MGVFSMRACCFVVLFLFTAFVFAQSSLPWEGTWSSNKRSSVGGNLYICVDPVLNIAHGAYSGIGLMSGTINNNVFMGTWYEAGYDKPYGQFRLVLSGSPFSGTWHYADSDDTFSWSGSRSSSVRPEADQCLVPGKSYAAGTYEHTEQICLNSAIVYQNTGFGSAAASFDGFGNVEGFSPDNGRTLLLSDFYLPLSGNGAYSFRPENNTAVFGPCSGCYQDAGDDEIQTGKIVVGVLIDDATFCGFFWDGLYNYQYGDSAVCFRKTSTKSPDSSVCGWGAAANALQHGHTVEIINEVQAAFDALQFPGVIIQPGEFVDDDDDLVTSNTSETTDETTADDDDTTYTTGETSETTDETTADDDTTYTTGETSFADDDDIFITDSYSSYTSIFDESSSGASILKVSIALLVVAVALIY